MLLLFRGTGYLQGRRCCCRRTGAPICATGLSWLHAVALSLVVVGIEILGLGEAVLEEGRGAGALEAAQLALTGLSRVRGEGGGAVRVVDAQVVFVPVASVLGQP